MSIEDELKHGTIVRMSHAQIEACPFKIMVPEHYRPDGTCKCDDVSHEMMAEWGYLWDSAKETWVSSYDDEGE